MRTVLLALVLFGVLVVLTSCRAPVSTPDARPDVWIGSISELNVSEFTYAIVECSDASLFQGTFIPFEVSSGSRSAFVDQADFRPLNDSCVLVTYALDSDLHEDVLAKGSFTVALDPQNTINESDETNNNATFSPNHVCIDADGDNPFLSAFVTASAGGDQLQLLDRCSNDTETEFTCDGSGRVQPVEYNCTNGCVAGSCRCLNSQTCLSDGSATRIT